MRTYFENRCDAPNGKLIFMMIISCKMTGETRLRAVGLNQDFQVAKNHISTKFSENLSDSIFSFPIQTYFQGPCHSQQMKHLYENWYVVTQVIFFLRSRISGKMLERGKCKTEVQNRNSENSPFHKNNQTSSKYCQNKLFQNTGNYWVLVTVKRPFIQEKWLNFSKSSKLYGILIFLIPISPSQICSSLESQQPQIMVNQELRQPRRSEQSWSSFTTSFSENCQHSTCLVP